MLIIYVVVTACRLNQHGLGCSTRNPGGLVILKMWVLHNELTDYHQINDAGLISGELYLEVYGGPHSGRTDIGCFADNDFHVTATAAWGGSTVLITLRLSSRFWYICYITGRCRL